MIEKECDVCGEKHPTEACPELGLDLEARPEVSRARLTLPHFVRASNLGSDEVGVFCQSNIAKKTQFGPFEAKKTTHEFNDDSLFILKITTKEGTSVSLDTTSENECNWLCLIRAAADVVQQNCIAYQLNTSIYYNTTRDIIQGEELRVWYAPTYAKRIGKPPYPDPNSRVMLGMKVIYPSVEDLQDAEQTTEKENEEKMKTSDEVNENMEETSSDNSIRKIVPEYRCKRCTFDCDTEIELAKHIREHITPWSSRKRGPKFKSPSSSHRQVGRPRKKLKIEDNSSVTSPRSSNVNEDDENEENNELVKEEVIGSDDERVDKDFIPLNTIKQESSHRVQPRRSLKGKRITGFNADENFESIFKSSKGLNFSRDSEMKTPEVRAKAIVLKPGQEYTKSNVSSPVQKRGRGRPKKILHPVDDTVVQTATSTIEKEEIGQGSENTDSSGPPPTEDNVEVHGQDAIKISDNETYDRNDNAVMSLEKKLENNLDPVSPVICTDAGDHNDNISEKVVPQADLGHQKTIDTNILPENPESIPGTKIPVETVAENSTETQNIDNNSISISNEQKVSDTETQPGGGEEGMEVDPLQSILDELDKGTVEMVDTTMSMKTADFVEQVVNIENEDNGDNSKETGENSEANCTDADDERLDKSAEDLPGVEETNEGTEVNETETDAENATEQEDDTMETESNHTNETSTDKELRIDVKDVQNYMLTVDDPEHKTSFLCKICKKKFLSERYLRLHMNRHTNKYTCKKCGNHYTRKDSYDAHRCDATEVKTGKTVSLKTKKLKKAKSNGKYSCDICNQSFSTQMYLFRHMAMHTDIFKCVKCGKCFSRKDSLQRHVLKCCPEQAAEYNIYSCKRCSKTFSTKLGAENHENSCTKCVCEICNRVFDSEELLSTHKLICVADDYVNGVKRFSCDSCSKSFKSLAYLKQHQQGHYGNIVCGLCNKKLTSLEHQEHHERYCFAQAVIQKYGNVKCDECEDEFITAKDYQAHYVQHLRPHVCEKCDKRFVKIGSLHNHVCVNENSDTKSVLTCKECNRTFQKERSLARHMEIHREKKYTCQFCKKKFHRRDYYNNHTCRDEDGNELDIDRNERNLSVACERLVCHVCGKNFVSSSNLNKHMKIHGEKTHSCPICNKKFHFVEYMRIHIQGFHEKKYQYQCTHCGKILTSKPGLISHTKLYHTDAPEVFRCPTCNKEFSQKGNLKTHMFSHTKEKSFQCPYCVKSFKYPDQLNKHKLIHTMENKLKCFHCDRVFVKAYELKRHCQLFHSGMMYVCDICGARCSHRHTISRHYQRKHPGFNLSKDQVFLDSLFKLVENKETPSEQVLQNEIHDAQIIPIGEFITGEELIPQAAAEALNSLSGTSIQGDNSTILTTEGTTAIVNADGTISMQGQEGQTYAIQNLQSIEGPDNQQQTVVILQIMNTQEGGEMLLEPQHIHVQQLETEVVNMKSENDPGVATIAKVDNFVQNYVQVVEQDTQQVHIINTPVVDTPTVADQSTVDTPTSEAPTVDAPAEDSTTVDTNKEIAVLPSQLIQ